MLKSSWKLWNLQFVMVYKDLKEDFRVIPDKLKDSFGGSVTMLPIPDDAPKEIPRLIIQSVDNFKIEISKSRINIFFETPPVFVKTFEQICDDLKEKTKLVFAALAIDLAWVGLIVKAVNLNSCANVNMKKFLSNSSDSLFPINSGSSDLIVKFHNDNTFEIEGKFFRGDFNMDLGSNIRKLMPNNLTGDQIGNILVLDMNTKMSNDNPYTIGIIYSFIDKVFEELDVIFDNLNDE